MTRVLKMEDFELWESAVTAVADPVTLEGLPVHLTHGYIGIQFFSDAGGTTPVTPGAGTVAMSVETIVNKNVFEAVGGSPMDATAPVTLSWTSPVKAVKAVPSSITTATHYKLVAAASED